METNVIKRCPIDEIKYIKMKQLIGNIIRDERLRKGLKVHELASKVGTKRYQAITEIETGSSNYGIEFLIKVTEALNITLELRTETIIKKPMFQFSKIEAVKEEI